MSKQHRGQVVPAGDGEQSRHYTQLEQINQLVGVSEANPDLSFMARLMALCSLPRTNPGNRKEYVRRNGPYTLYMIAGGGNNLPFGNLPRLLLAWVCTEAVRTKWRELMLGSSACRMTVAALVAIGPASRIKCDGCLVLDHLYS